MNTQKRLDWIDVAKGFGIICVIFAHLEEVYLKAPIYTFHMPLFFFLSGYLFSTKSSFPEFLKNKCKHILIPYACLGSILVAFDIWWQQRTSFSFNWGYVQYQIMQFLTNKRFLTLWYLACMFFLNLLMYAIVRFIKNEKIQAVVVLILAIAGFWYAENVGQALFWNIDVCFTALPFFYVGYICRKKQVMDKMFELKAVWKWLLFVLLIVINGVCLTINQNVKGETLEMFFNQYGIEPVTYLGAFCAIGAIILAAKAIHCKPLQYLGEYSILYYAWHQTMLMPVVYNFFNEQHWFMDAVFNKKEYFAQKILALVIILVVMTLMNEVIRRTKLRFMLGK